MRQSPRFRYLHGRDSRGDYCFKLCSRAKRYLHQRGFYLADERRKPSSPCLKMLHSQLPVDDGGGGSETGCLCGVSELLCYFPSWMTVNGPQRHSLPSLLNAWMRVNVFVGWWWSQTHWISISTVVFLCFASVFCFYFPSVFLDLWKIVEENETSYLLPKWLPQLRYYLQFHLLLHLKNTGKIWLTLAVRRLILNSPQAKMSG